MHIELKRATSSLNSGIGLPETSFTETKINLKIKLLEIWDMMNQDESRYIYMDESLAFDTKSLLHEVRKECKELGIKKILTGNGVTKIKHEKPGSK